MRSKYADSTDFFDINKALACIRQVATPTPPQTASFRVCRARESTGQKLQCTCARTHT